MGRALGFTRLSGTHTYCPFSGQVGLLQGPLSLEWDGFSLETDGTGAQTLPGSAWLLHTQLLGQMHSPPLVGRQHGEAPGFAITPLLLHPGLGSFLFLARAEF